MDRIFETISGAESTANTYGYDIKHPEFINMGEGYEHVWVWEYKHKFTSSLCRIADLRSVQRKVKEGDRIPNIIGFVQLSTK